MHRKLHQLNGAHEALAALADGFFTDSDWIENVQQVLPEAMPQTAGALLVHEQHMTATLREHYGCPIELNVLDHQQAGDQYRRKIVLTVDEGRTVVEFGLVRLDLSATSAQAREAVLQRRQPLGDIFGQHRVLTRVQPLWYLRFTPDCPLVEYFRPAVAGPLYGRIGVIHWDGRPALELLEVVRTD